MPPRRPDAPHDAHTIGRILLTLTLALCLAACGEEEPPAEGDYGAACTGSCAPGLSCILSDSFPGGYCASLCDTESCLSGAVCDPDVAPALCLQACGSADACRAGYQCWRGACRPGCSADGDCMGGTCDMGTCIDPECREDSDCPGGSACIANACVMQVDGGMQLPLGTACSADGDCASARCLDAASGGTCTQACATPPDCIGGAVEMGCSAVNTAGGVEALCTPVPAGGTGLATLCTTDAECIGRTCQDGQCTEVCSSGTECLAGQICTSLPRNGGTFMGCGYTSISGVTIEEIPLDARNLAAGGALEFRRALPSDTVSLTLRARRTGGDPLDLTFGSVTDPDGTSLFDLETIAALTDTPNRWIPADTGEVVSMLVPNTTPDRVAMRGGLYVWTAGSLPRTEGDTGSADVSFSALVKRAPGGTVATGTLDITVFLVGVGLTATTAASNAKLQGALTRLDTLLTQTGIGLGSVEYEQITGADASALNVINSTEGADSELARLFSLSEGRSGRRLNLFLVRSIETGDDGFAALGVAGGIPGPVGQHGTQHSGVVSSFDDAVVGSGNMGARIVGHILAHEVGHYLGLFHGTERLRACGPGEEPADGCAPFGSQDPIADTTRGDTSNLMYWSIVGAGNNQTLSSGQGRVLRNSALVGP
ncbi:MAG: hypothetical protein AB8I08_40240 [Sandaracinaceae bacterium]